MLIHIWNLFAQAGSLWVAWVETNWLKGRNFWQIPILNSCSWSWKKLLNLREIAKNFIWFNVGDGSRIFLWYDQWHPDGCLLDKFGFRAIYDAISHVGARVSSINCDGDWYWPFARSDSIVQIQNRLPEIQLGGADLPIWNSKKGVYSCVDTWEILRAKKPVVSWFKAVWFLMAIPRHSFLLWLVFRDAFVTKAKMCSWGYGRYTLCRFCFGRQECIEHLFFLCSFSRRIWKTLMIDCLIFNPIVEWEDVAHWSIEVLKGRSLQVSLCRLCLVAFIYHIWKQHDDLSHGKSPRSEGVLVTQIRWEVRSRIMAKEALKKASYNSKQVQIWNLHSLMYVICLQVYLF
jgi:hypothetical protein